jgi:hypothetical protein
MLYGFKTSDSFRLLRTTRSKTDFIRRYRLDCFVASLLAIASVGILAAQFASELCENLVPPKTEGAGNAGRCPHP